MQQAIQLMPGAVDGVVIELQRLLGAQNVLTDRTEREFYSQDVYRAGAAGGRDPSRQHRGAGRRAEADRAFRPAGSCRGAAACPLTDGYLPKHADSILVDMLRMKTACWNQYRGLLRHGECGITWKDMRRARAARRARRTTGALGPALSTVGGALSPGSIGSGGYGAAAESVIGLDVLLADGSILSSAAMRTGNGQPFFRQGPPDTMAMFLSDTGSLGIKGATFRLIRPAARVALPVVPFGGRRAVRGDGEVARRRSANSSSIRACGRCA